MKYSFHFNRESIIRIPHFFILDTYSGFSVQILHFHLCISCVLEAFSILDLLFSIIDIFIRYLNCFCNQRRGLLHYDLQFVTYCFAPVTKTESSHSCAMQFVGECCLLISFSLIYHIQSHIDLMCHKSFNFIFFFFLFFTF